MSYTGEKACSLTDPAQHGLLFPLDTEILKIGHIQNSQDSTVQRMIEILNMGMFLRSSVLLPVVHISPYLKSRML